MAENKETNNEIKIGPGIKTFAISQKQAKKHILYPEQRNLFLMCLKLQHVTSSLSSPNTLAVAGLVTAPFVAFFGMINPYLNKTKPKIHWLNKLYYSKLTNKIFKDILIWIQDDTVDKMNKKQK